LAQDPYQELGVSRGASAAEIRKAFHKLAKKHHPDVNPGDKSAEEKFKRVSGAFDLLGDAEKRRKFDAGEIDADGRETARAYGPGPFGQGAYGENPFGEGGAQNPFGAGQGGFRSAAFEGVDLNDILGEVFGGRPGGGRAGGFSARGGDVRARLEIDLEDAIAGGKKRVPFTDGRTLDINIPKGVVDGQTLRLKGQGAPGRTGAGDALIEIAIRPHPVYRREGDNNLVMDVPVSVPDAVLGGKVQVDTPDGPVTLSLPKGSNSGATLRLKGRGLADAKGARGDLMARLIVTLPDEPDGELEAFARTWRADRPYTPRRRR
jgi:DnaJ-class molecular chaperone